LSAAGPLLTESKVDAVLLDLPPDEAAALELVSQAHALATHLPLLAVGPWHPDSPTALQFIRRGAQDYLERSQIAGGQLPRLLSRSIVRKKVEREMLESESRYHTLMEHASDGIAIYDQQGTIVDLNTSASELLGYPKEEAIGRNVVEFIAPEDLAQTPLRFDQLLSGRAVVGERVLVRKGGARLPVELSARMFGDGWVQVIIRDITERKQAEEEIRKLNEELEARVMERTAQVENQRALLETIIDATPVGLVLFDTEMRVVSLNAAWAQLSGVDYLSAPGKLIYDLAPSTRARRPVYDRVLRGEAFVDPGVEYRHPVDGQVRYYDIHYTPVRGAQGEVAGVLTAVVDATSRHELDRQKDEFLALTSHELRTPLTSIKAYAQRGARSASNLGDPMLSRTLHIINEQSDRLVRLIEDLLDVSRMQSGGPTFRMEQLDLRDLARRVAGELQALATDFTLDLKLSPQPVTVRADQERIRQVLVNLGENAVKYSGASRRIELEVSEKGQEAVTSVRDYGIGIPLHQQGQVFDRFFRSPEARVANREGLGLGLYISREIVLRHGGRMWVESREGEGSAFYFALPLMAGE
jgi:PAS domain S-box-containing protein